MDVNIDYHRCMTTLPLLPSAACCVSSGGAPMSVADAEGLAGRLKALGDPTRLRLLSIVASAAEQEACVCDLTEPVGLSQPTVSHHMRVLVDAGLATREQRGRWAYYRVVTDALESASRALRS